MTARSWAWPSLAVVIGMAASIGAVEIGLRAAAWAGWISVWRDIAQARTASIWIKSDHPELIYRHRPNYITDGVRHTERHGILRPFDASPRHPAVGRRIVVLGDSVAAAIRMPYEDRVFTRVEQGLVRRTGQPVEVLNFAVNGYSTIQEAALFEELAGRFESDLLVLQFCVNDFYPTQFPTWWYLDHPASHLMTLVSRALDRRLLRGYPPAAFWERLYREDTAGWAAVAEGFGRIASLAATTGVPVLLVIFPALSHGGWLEGDAVGRHERVATLGRATGFEVLDLLPVLSVHSVEALRGDPWDTFHPNRLGHRLAADAAVDWLVAEWR